jgi:hypothetical protein
MHGPRWAVALACLLLSPVAEARVFKLSEADVSAYFFGTAALSRIGDAPFALSSGSDTLFNEEVAYNFSGELGFTYRMSPGLFLRVGAQLLQSKTLTRAEGRDAGDQLLLYLTSRAFAFVPHGTLELDALQSDSERAFFFLGVGAADVSLDNDYEFTATGLATYPAVTSDYKETSGQSLISSHAGVGYEGLFADNVTFFTEAGYRMLVASRLKYKDDFSTPEGAKTKGAPALNSDGTDRIVDLSGFFVGFGFKFYLSFDR